MGRSLSHRAAAALATALSFAVGPLGAAQPQQSAPPTVLPSVEVSAFRDPVEKSYRKIVSGMDLFEQRRALLAPGAALRFKLLPRHRDTDMQRISLNVLGETVAIPVRVDEDNTFTLERYPQALKEDAVVVPNRKVRSMTWRTEIRTPGLPPNTRRLGDLRLECLVGIESGLISAVRPLFGFLTSADGYCNRAEEVHYLFFAERPLFGVTLVSGNRRETLPVDAMYAGITREPMTPSELARCDCEVLIDRTYYAPLGDATWPNDTLIVLEYMDE